MPAPQYNAGRDDALFEIIRRMAEAGEPTPRHRDLAEALTEAGFPISATNIANIVMRLRVANRIDVTGEFDGSGENRAYAIVGTEHRTTPREHCVGRPLGSVSAPRHTYAAYDAAVAAGEFGRPEHQSGERPGPIVFVRMPYGAHSLTGCSAADCARVGSKRDRRAA